MKESVGEFLNRMVREQEAWVRSCGGSLGGYLEKYRQYGRSDEEIEKIYDADFEALANWCERLNAYNRRYSGRRA